MMFLDFFYFSRPIDRKRQVRVYVATDGNFRNHSNNSDPCLTKISTLISGNILPEQYQYQYQYWKSDWFVSLRTRAPVLGRRRTFVRSGPRRTKDEKHPPDSGTDSKLRNLRPGQNSNLMKFFNKSMIWRWKIENGKLVTKIRFKIFSSRSPV